TSFAAGRSDLARDVGRRRRVVAEDRSRAHRRDDAAAAERYLAQIGVVADAAEHDLGALRGCRRRRSRLAAVLLAPLVGLRGRAVVDRDAVALLREPTCHGK